MPQLIHQGDNTSSRSGWKTLPFIITNEVMERGASVGLIPVCIKYLADEYHLSMASIAIFVLIVGAARNFTPIFGAHASKSHGRFKIIAFGSGITLQGLSILWATSMFSELRPSVDCSYEEKVWKLLLLFSAFVIMSIGAGAIRPCSPTFGADQISNPNNPNNRRTIEGYYSGYYSLVGVAVVVSVAGLSAMQDHVEWHTLFAIPPALMLLSFISFMIGSSQYVKVLVTSSSSQNNVGAVLMAAWRRRSLLMPAYDISRWSNPEQSTFVRPTDRLRIVFKMYSFLNRACLLIEGEEPKNPTTSLASVREVEEFKTLFSAIPIWTTTIILTVATTPGALPNYQAQEMDRHIGHMSLSPASYALFSVGAMTAWMIFYTHALVPVIARFASNRLPNGIPPRFRMAMGIFMSCLGNVVMGFVEKRRRVSPMGTMSGSWLIPQLAMLGIGEALYMMGMLDFFNSRFPESMKSLGNALLSLGQCIGMLTAAFLLGQLRRHTLWVQEDINNGHLENYYWFVAGLSLLNFCYFLICSWAHGNHHHITWDDQPQVEEDVGRWGGECGICEDGG
ncbi:Protein NRT1/ PTR FAMILY 1.2 [Linum perenne]